MDTHTWSGSIGRSSARRRATSSTTTARSPSWATCTGPCFDRGNHLQSVRVCATT